MGMFCWKLYAKWHMYIACAFSGEWAHSFHYIVKGWRLQETWETKMHKTYSSHWGYWNISEINTVNGSIKIRVKVYYTIDKKNKVTVINWREELRLDLGLKISYLLKFHGTSILWGKEHEQGLGLELIKAFGRIIQRPCLEWNLKKLLSTWDTNKVHGL